MARSSLTHSLTHALALAGLLLLIPTQAPAASSPEVFGEWIVSNDNGVNLAFATSDGGQSLMLRCDGNGCMWMLVTKNPCTPGVRTNMLFSPSAPTVRESRPEGRMPRPNPEQWLLPSGAHALR